MTPRHPAPILAALALALLAPLGCGEAEKTQGDPSAARPVVHVTDDITLATTWTKENVYVVDNSIGLTAVLTFEPDTIVKFAQGAALTVNAGGSILTDTSADAGCVFTSDRDDSNGGDSNGDGAESSPARGDWGYVWVQASGSVFDGCRFTYGGANMPYDGVFLVSSDVSITITNCTFAHNQGGTPDDLRAAALNLGSAVAPTVLTGNTFFDNDVPLVISSAFDVDDSNVFVADEEGVTLGNAYQGIFWGGAYETIAEVSWSNTRVPFVIAGAPLGVAEDASLTLGDDVIVKFGAGQRIDVAGVLTANGSNGILFTSLLDDSAGGDTNGDGAATTAAPGDWGYLDVSADGSLFNHCRFSYAGSAAPYHATFEVSQQHTVTITNSTFAHNSGGTLEDNRAAALNLAGAIAGTVVTGNVFYDNDMPLVINGLVDLDDSNEFHFLPTDAATPLTNKFNGIFMDGALHSVSGAASWGETEVAFVMLQNAVLTVELGGTLTLGDGVVLKFDAGRLDEIGTIEQGADNFFTSITDDAHCGDTNGDGTASSPVAGDWAGVNNCQNSPCHYEDWANILYAANP